MNFYWWMFHGLGYGLKKYEQLCDMYVDIGSFAVEEMKDFIGE